MRVHDQQPPSDRQTSLRPALAQLLVLALACACAPVQTAPATAMAAADPAPAAPTDIGWPREVSDGGNTITIYQPQVESWTGNQLNGRAAVSVATAASPTPTFGVLWFSARTEVDKQARLVTLEDIKVTRSSFPTRPQDADAYVQAIENGFPGGARTISLDRLEANLAVSRAEQGHGTTVAVKNAPPRILFSDKPAILVLVDGKPVLRQVPDSSNLLRVINTRVLILLDQSSGTYYLHVMNGWASASAIEGPWSAAADPPASLAAAQEAIAKTGSVDLLTDPPGVSSSDLPAGTLPAIYVATGAAELIQSKGPPDFTPVGGTNLLAVKNSSSDIFMDTADQTYFVLISGRWFKSSSLTDGPWQFVASNTLPADFAKIPWQDPKGTVLTSVASTPQAAEARISSNVPQTATVTRATTQMPAPVYDGEPKFEPIQGTKLTYAANTATPVIQTSPGVYYAVVNGVWFTAAGPSGPWVVADSVPPAIYTIPPNSPLYYVTYVYVYGATPEVVYVGYTPGYYGTYVVPAGTVVYGTGYVYEPWVGTVWIGPPYTYGFGAGFAWGAAAGFALGVAAGAYCHPWWGPVGWGWGYGTWSASYTHVSVNTWNAYGHWGNSVAWGSNGHYAGHVGNTTFAGAKGGDVYADHNGNVYRRNDGNWQKWDNGSWNNTNAKANAQSKLQANGGAQGVKDRAQADGLGANRATSSSDLSSLNRDYQSRQTGDDWANQWSKARSGGTGDGFGGDRFGSDLGGGFHPGSFGGGGGFGGFRGGGGFRR